MNGQTLAVERPKVAVVSHTTASWGWVINCKGWCFDVRILVSPQLHDDALTRLSKLYPVSSYS